MSVPIRTASWRSTRAWSCLVLVLAAALSTGARTRPQTAPVPARPRAAEGAEEASELAAGWTLLAQGHVEQASARSARLLERFPRSGAVLTLAVEADILRAGALAGLDRYERWLGPRTLEEPAVLRRVALAVLREAVAQANDRTARAEAWRGLNEDGESVPLPFGPVAGLETPAADLTAMAAVGSEGAVRALRTRMPADSAGRVRALEALGESASELASDPIRQALQDVRIEVRAAAVEALGKVGGPDAVSALKSMLSDHSVLVRGKAAGALYRLGDNSGLPVLESMSADDAPTVRLLAAEGLASRPDAAWTAMVTSLTANQDPQIRAWAARLIAPQDPGLAKNVLDALLLDPNPAIRDLAAIDYGEIVASCDLVTLRRLLRQAPLTTKVRAAARILAVLR